MSNFQFQLNGQDCVLITVIEYNRMTNEAAVLSRAVELLLERLGVVEIRIGNVHVYQGADGGADGWFIDENSNHLEAVDYALAEHGSGS